MVWYIKEGKKPETVAVAKVHHDDFPNLCFMIRPADSGRNEEK